MPAAHAWGCRVTDALNLFDPMTDLALLPRLAGYTATPVTTGASGGTVLRLAGDGLEMLYLKHGRGAVADDITSDMPRLLWAAEHIAVPRVRAFARDDDRAELLTTALPGVPAYAAVGAAMDAPLAERVALVHALGTFVRTLHAIPVDSCPFDASAPLRLAHAQRNLEAGLVDESDFDEARAGQSAEQVWAAMQALLPLPFERVVTHGDCSLDNLFVHQGRVTGCLDVGRLGVADPYQDLAILANCLGEFDETLVDELFRAYGLREPDADRLAFHLMLDEFF
jgi:aminoglycoside 3'-phosphotransferase-1